MARMVVMLLAIAVCWSSAQAEEIQTWKTDKGASVYYLNAPELNVVDVRVVFSAGAARDGSKPGVALFTNRMLDEGAAGKDAQAIAETFDANGASYGAGSLRDMAWLSLRSLATPEYLQPALSQFVQVLGAPDFPESSFQRIQAQLLQAITAKQQQPGAIAGELFYQALYGDHPYGQPSGGTEQSISTMTVRDLRSFYEQHYVANNAIIAIVGRVDRAQAEQISQQISGALLAGESLPAVVSPTANPKAQQVVKGFPSSQTQLIFGQLGVARNDPDWVALYVGNYILGGSGLVSRLSEEVREKRGLTYGVHSYFSPMQAEGPFVVTLTTRADQANQAMAVVKSELEQFVSRGPTAEELEAAKKNITGGWPLRVASNSSKVEYLAMMGFYGNRLDYLQWFPEQVAKLTVDDIKKALQKHLTPAQMTTVLVGPEASDG